MYITNGLTYKIQNVLYISDGDRKIVKTELLIKSIKNIIVVRCYKSPDVHWKNQCDHLPELLTNPTM